MMRDDSVYLKHIPDAINQIETYLQGITHSQFVQNRLLQDGVVRQLEIIGEAARHLADSYREAHPVVPWSQIIAMRNRAIHEYFDVNVTIVWEVAKHDLPVLQENIESLLREE